jgi:uncharacterized repeat protein (TIGR01451 family)
MLNQTEITTNTNQTPIPSANDSVKKELPKKNKLSIYLVLTLILVVALAGIGISLRQFFIRDTVAPTAPSESQANIDKIQECSVSFDVVPPESEIDCIKESYRDELSNTPREYDLVQTQSQFNPGDVVVYSFVVKNNGEQVATITATDTLQINISDDVVFDYEFLDSNCDQDSFENNTLTCVAENLNPGEEENFTFRIRLSELITTNLNLTNNVNITDGSSINSCSIEIDINADTQAYCNEGCSVNNDCVEANQACIENVCRLVTNPESETCEDVVEITPTPETEAYCGEYCETNLDCVGDDQICYANECRLSSNPTDVDCKPPVEEPTPTPETNAYCGDYCSTNADCVSSDNICYFNECRLAEYPDRADCSVPQVVTTTTYVEPTPTANCNQDCVTNRDCSDNDHICYEGNCRLAEYPASTTCTIPGSADQPKMPEELPQSGSDDLINWIKAGIGILGAGALLLLL